MKNSVLFAAGVLFGTAGIKLLGSKGCQEGLRPHHRRRAAGKGGRDETVTAVRGG